MGSSSHHDGLCRDHVVQRANHRPFFIVRILPGDSGTVSFRDQATMPRSNPFAHALGLDQPLYIQYVEFMRACSPVNWGRSMVSGRPVIQEILNVLPADDRTHWSPR